MLGKLTFVFRIYCAFLKVWNQKNGGKKRLALALEEQQIEGKENHTLHNM